MKTFLYHVKGKYLTSKFDSVQTTGVTESRKFSRLDLFESEGFQEIHQKPSNDMILDTLEYFLTEKKYRRNLKFLRLLSLLP